MNLDQMEIMHPDSFVLQLFWLEHLEKSLKDLSVDQDLTPVDISMNADDDVL